MYLLLIFTVSAFSALLTKVKVIEDQGCVESNENIQTSMWIPVWRTWVSSVKLSDFPEEKYCIPLYVCCYYTCVLLVNVQGIIKYKLYVLHAVYDCHYLVSCSFFFLSTIRKNVRLTDMLEAALPPMLQTCMSALCPAIPIWPNCRKWISSEAAFCLSVSDKSILNSISPHSQSIPLGEEDHFYVTASRRAEGLGSAFLVIVCVCVCVCVRCFFPAPLLQKSNVAKALINTFREPKRDCLSRCLCLSLHPRNGCTESLFIFLYKLLFRFLMDIFHHILWQHHPAKVIWSVWITQNKPTQSTLKS